MKNHHIYFLIGTLILLSSCSKLTPLKQYIHDAGKVEVMIYSGGLPQLQYADNDQDKIQQWINYISDSITTAPNCNFEGTLTFVSGDDSIPMRFSLKPSCTVVSYSMKGKNYIQPLTPEGIKFINSLEDRRQMFGK